MHTTIGPSPHRKIEKIAETYGLSFAKHVVVFVHMEDEPWSGKRPFLNGTYPVFQGFVMMVHKSIHWPVRPTKQFVESVQGIIEKSKVVQVYVQNGSHRISTKPATCA